MESSKQTQKLPHILIIPYPTQGHINPMLQFSKQLTINHTLKTTFIITNFISKSFKPKSPHLNIDTISDGYDSGGFTQSKSISDYISTFKTAGSTTLAKLIEKYLSSSNPITCVVYDTFMPWVLDVAKEYGLVGAAFMTQSCAVDYIYYCLYHGSLKLPVSGKVCVPGLPVLEIRDMPGFVEVPESYPAYFELVLQQWRNLKKADVLLINTFYELEPEVVNAMSESVPNPVLTIGPTIPSAYLEDNQDDNHQQHENKIYGFDLFHLEPPTPTIQWLSTKPSRSVIYVSFGSLSNLPGHQMLELLSGLKKTNYPFLWAIRSSEMSKLPNNFLEATATDEENCLIVSWTSQVEVLSHESIGCFLSHCGWNSCVEALSLGVPMVAMPQWTDQPADAKFVADVWKVGVRVKVDEKGLVGREEVEACLKEVMEGERSNEMKRNAEKWSRLAKLSMSEEGSSCKNIDRLVSMLAALSLNI